MRLPNLLSNKIAVIGLGYVGLPLAVEFSKKNKCLLTGEILNRNVVGYDIDSKRIGELINGEDRNNEITTKDFQEAELVKFTNDKSLKVPHMGWNELTFAETRHPVLKGLDDGTHVYFVHSYHMVCTDSADILASTDYGGPVTAAVGRENLFGTQFHPEKSQATGLELIKNFLSWAP